MKLPTVSIGVNPHWYSKFWIQQFYQLWRQGEIRLRPLLGWANPPMCFSFQVDDNRCLIDVSDHKTLAHNPADYAVYFKANYDPAQPYPGNVLASINGTTLTRSNVPPDPSDYEYDIVWLAGISGGRPHKVALYEALASLPLKVKLAAKMVSPHDWEQWAPRLRAAGVEVWRDNLSYRQWLDWCKKGRWCVLVRGKHDCLSFKMIDYMSIGAAVMADYPPTSQWPIPVQSGQHFLDLQLSGTLTNDLTDQQYSQLVSEYRERLHALVPQFRDETLRQRIAGNNYDYFTKHIAHGQAARDVLAKAIASIRGTVAV